MPSKLIDLDSDEKVNLFIEEIKNLENNKSSNPCIISC
jgi:hypothetical protein